MGKLLSWVVIIALGWLAWKFFLVVQRKSQAGGKPGGGQDGRNDHEGREDRGGAGAGTAASATARPAVDGKPGHPTPSEPSGGELMVRCDHCGLYLPRSESQIAAGHRYCSSAHRDAGPRKLE